ncbi:unnamed protein product [Trifolium pratense]|uniref:Uncharacterized protein n=1 Tax=Trifolium pratense TaxID=57577 RepID=A0ACB0K397_TRIPR|nr:unnamed protein product [Trifolium pratense]
MSDSVKSSPSKTNAAPSTQKEVINAIPLNSIPFTSPKMRRKSVAKKERSSRANPSSPSSSIKKSKKKSKKSRTESSKSYTMSELHVDPLPSSDAPTPVVDATKDNVDTSGKNPPNPNSDVPNSVKNLGIEKPTVTDNLGKSTPNSPIAVNTDVDAATETNVDVSTESPTKIDTETHVMPSAATHGDTPNVVPDVTTSLAQENLVDYSESDESPPPKATDKETVPDKAVNDNPEASVARRTRSRVNKGVETASTPVQTPKPSKAGKATGKKPVYGPPKPVSKVVPRSETKKRKAPPTSDSDFEPETDVAASGSTSRKSIGRKKVPQTVPYAPLDNISFHLENGSARWKFVYHRRLALERNLKDYILECPPVVEALEYAGLMKTVVGLDKCYDRLVKEFLINVAADCNDPASPEYRQVFVRGKCVKFSPIVINQYLQRSSDEVAPLKATDNEICKVLTGGKIKVWPSKAKLSATSLSPFYAVLNRIAAHNWVPTTHSVPVIPNSDSNDEVENELRRSKRVRVARDYGPDYATFTLNEDPANLQEALSSMDADLWQEAINDEMDSLESNKTWHLVDLPPGCKPIGCKWILKKKLKPDGTVEKYKARLVAKGFRQRENIDFFDTFSPVTRITSIRVLISIAAIYNLIVHQMDVKTAFLNGDLEEEIYMEQPEGFVIHGQETKVFLQKKETKVCKLDKSLYGLKQAPKQWHEKFDNLMILNGFRLNESDKCIYYKCDGNICTIICLYVDDMLIFGSNLSAINNVKSMLSNNFDMKDLGEASVILGIKITRSEKGISLDQSHYVEKILKKYGYFNCKPACTPYDPSVKLFKNTGDSVRQTEYASIIGSLRYATDCTRPDIAYVVGLLCRFTSRPSDEHWHAIERVMRYLKRTMNLGLHYQRFPAVLEGYSDADWNTLSDDSKATSGFIFSIAGGAVSWKSKKQTILAQSTMESEMIALATASEEASWLRCLLSEIPLWEKPMPAVLIHCDSTAAIAKIENRFYNGKRRQIRRKHSTVRELITTGAVRVDHVRTNDNLADPLTKGLAREKVQNTSVKMGLMPMK